PELARPQRGFPGNGIIPGKGYLGVRTGPDKSSFYDPDSRVIRFNKGDTLITPLGDLITRSTGGTAITDVRDPTGLFVIPSSKDFILTQHSDGIAYGAIWMIFQSTIDFQGWVPKFDPSKPEQRGVD